MTDETPTPTHDDFAAELPELAAGILDGRERALLLNHVTNCSFCMDELEQLTAAADSLVFLASDVDPPVGFESRVFDRLGVQVSDAPPHRGWQRRSVIFATAAAIVALSFVGGWIVHSSVDSTNHRAASAAENYDGLTEAPLVSGSQTLGMVSVYSGTPSWLFMTVEASTGTGTVQCVVTTNNGSSHTIGSFYLASGRGAWDAPLPVDAKDVRTATIVTASGHVVASAQIS